MTQFEQMKAALASARVRITSMMRTVQDHDRAKPTLAEIDAALALRPRNCNVGTLEEQSERFNAFCKKQGNGCCVGRSNGQCPIFRGYKLDCALVWSQTPYTAEGEVVK